MTRPLYHKVVGLAVIAAMLQAQVGFADPAFLRSRRVAEDPHRKAVLIPHTVRVPVDIIASYVSPEEEARDWEVGFFTRSEHGEILAPVIRDPRIKHPLSIHGRTVFNLPGVEALTQGIRVRVVKGAGVLNPQQFRGTSFGYERRHDIRSEQFRGGETELWARVSAEVALAMHGVFAEAMAAGDPIVTAAAEKYQIQEAPVMRPRYVLRPLKIPVAQRNHMVLVDQAQALRRVKVPEEFIQHQAMLVYDIPYPRRLEEWPPGMSIDWMAEWRAVANTNDDAQLFRQFGARLAVAFHLMHDWLSGTFSELVSTQEGRYYTALTTGDTMVTGYPTDFDVTHFSRESQRARQAIPSLRFTEDGFLDPHEMADLQSHDYVFAIDLIAELGERLGLHPRIGWEAFADVLIFSRLPADASEEFRWALAVWFWDLWGTGPPQWREWRQSMQASPGNAVVHIWGISHLIRHELSNGTPRSTIAQEVVGLLDQAASLYAADPSTTHLVPTLQTLAENAEHVVEFFSRVYGSLDQLPSLVAFPYLLDKKMSRSLNVSL